MTKHPTRQQLIAMAQTGSGNFENHLASCKECRLLFELFCKFRVQGEPLLPDAPESWIRTAQRIGERESVAGKVRRWVADLTFDSWSANLALGVRGAAIDERRLRFDTDGICFDLRAEKHSGEWLFIGKIIEPDSDAGQFRLRVGRRLITADDAGYFTWSSKTPPAKFILEDDNNQIVVEDISWKRPTI